RAVSRQRQRHWRRGEARRAAMTLRGRMRQAARGWIARAQQHEQQMVLRRCASVGERVRLRHPVVIYHPETLTIGSDVDIGEFSHLRASGGLTIGSRVLIAANVVISTRTHPVT